MSNGLHEFPEGVTKKLFTEPEAGKYLGRSVWSMRELRYAKKLPFVRVGRRIHYLQEDLDQFIADHRVEADDYGEE